MKLLHVPFCYYPDAVGGTEVYVASLARIQQNRGFEVAIAAPADESGSYVHDRIPVHRFGIGRDLNLRQLYGEGDPVAARNFETILNRFRPDILHLHAFTSAIPGLVAQSARAREIPVVFTYHTPTITCCRGTMLEWGEQPCDGKMRVKRCASCMLHGKGLSRISSRVIAEMGGLAHGVRREGGIWTALRSAELVAIRHAAVKEFLSEQTDHIFAVCEWVRAVLLANGIPAEKITLSRQGSAYPSITKEVKAGKSRSLRFAFFGRIDPAKGVGILIDALALVPNIDLQLDIFTVTQGEQSRNEQKALLAKAAADRRIQFHDPVDPTEIVERLRSYDALLVPSQGLETGPLVVYEAFAAGVPVIGSKLGGIAELVRDGETGLLVEPGSHRAWADAIFRFVEDVPLQRKLKDSRKPVRTAEGAADDVSPIYARLLNREAALAL